MVALGRQVIPNDSDSLDKIYVILFEAVYKCAHSRLRINKAYSLYQSNAVLSLSKGVCGCGIEPCTIIFKCYVQSARKA